MHLKMANKSGILVLLVFIISLLTFVVFKSWHEETQLTNCIQKTLNSQQIVNIEATIKNRGQKPILSGKLTQEKKDTLLNAINNQCEVTEIQDFIEIIEPPVTIASSLNFKIDYVNNTINVSGLVNNQQQIDNILNSFKNAIKDNFPPSDLDWTLAHDISMDNNSQKFDFDIHITLLFTAIHNIKLADITLEKNQLILKGIVRDQIREKETLSKIKRLFDDKYTIINQLELVIKLKPDIPGIRFEKLPPPVLPDIPI